MGTKVHCTNFLPGFYTMRDLNEDSDDFLSQYYDYKPAGRNLYNCYQLGQSNGYSEYDKEMIKRTMLEHEAIFRKQVYELHRLYRIQKEMMDELKKGPCKLLQGDTSQSNSFSSQIPSEGTSKMFQLAHLPEATSSNNRARLTITDNTEPTLNFLNESIVQSVTVFTGKEIALNDGDMLDSNNKDLPRRMFDLQLPADVYIDCEEEERSGKEIVAESSSVTTVPLDRTQGADPGNNVKLTLCMTKDPNCKKEIWKSDILTQKCPSTRNLSDLNEPAREMYFGKAAGSVSAKCLGTNTPLAENQGLQLPMRSNTSLSGLPTAFLKGRHSEGGANSNHLHVDGDETSRKWPFFNNEAGQNASSMLFSPDSSKVKFSMPSERIQPNQKPHEILSIDQNKTLTWFKPKLEVRRGPQYGQSAAALPNSFSDPYLVYTNSSSPLLSSWTNPVSGCSHVPLVAPSHQCFLGSVTQNHGNPPDKWHYSGDLRSHYGVGMDPTSYQNGFNHGIRLDYNSASQLYTPPLSFGKPNLRGRSDHNPDGCGPQKSQKDVHLNQKLFNGFQDGLTTQKVNESQQKCEDSSGALSWLRKIPTCNSSSLMELDLSRGYPQLKASCSTMDAEYERRQETEKSISFFNLQDLPSSSQVKETTTERNVESEAQSSKKLFGFAIPARNQQSAAIAPHHEKSQIVATMYVEKERLNLSTVETHIDPGDQVTKSSSLRNHINLNFDLNLSYFSGEGEMLDAPLQASAPTVASGIDLEAPIVLEEGHQEEVLVTEAAENILWISTDKCSHLDKMDPLSLVFFNTLHWFAEVASSNAEIVKEILDDGSDTFEQLTLELEETKPEEYWCWSREGLDQKEEDDVGDRKSNIASLLFTKPRRGQQRKRRQKRDFQRDILPALVSLSRHEVSEDFQTIGALMKASGLSWQAGATTRRNGNRNGTNARGKVGRKPRNLAATVEESQVSPPPPPPQLAVAQPASNSEAEVDGKNMIGWGRTTRRCRRQRLPPVTYHCCGSSNLTK